MLFDSGDPQDGGHLSKRAIKVMNAERRRLLDPAVAGNAVAANLVAHGQQVLGVDNYTSACASLRQEGLLAASEAGEQPVAIDLK